MRCLGIDYGTKRIGLAWGDALGVATPLKAATQATQEERKDYIASIIEERKPEQLVVGYPYNMDGTVGFKAKEVDAFIDELQEQFCLPVQRVDERLTSHAVEQNMGLSGRKERALRKEGIVDSGAAALILQDWLDLHVNTGSMPDLWDETED